VAKPQESTSLTNKPRRPLPHLVESRNHTDSDQAQLLSEKSEDSKRALNSSSESFPSKDSLEKSLPSSRMTSDSNHLLSSLSKKPQKHTWSVSLKTPTSAPSTPRELPSCQKTCNWPEESEVRDLEHPSTDYRKRMCYLLLISNILKTHTFIFYTIFITSINYLSF
jgi:hypothetical protein